jgi:prevent-host-death family protein
MKTATVRELRNDYAKLLRRVEAGEQIVITRRGKSVARLVPERHQPDKKVDWTKSAAFRWDRRGERVLTAKESAEAIQASRGRWW